MIKTLGRSVRQFKASSAATAALSALEVVFEIVVPLAMSRLLIMEFTPAAWGRFGNTD